MKKVVLSMVMCAALLASSAVMAQSTKTAPAPKAKTEAKTEAKAEAKPAKAEKKSSTTKKVEEPKKAASESSKTK